MKSLYFPSILHYVTILGIENVKIVNFEDFLEVENFNENYISNFDVGDNGIKPNPNPDPNASPNPNPDYTNFVGNISNQENLYKIEDIYQLSTAVKTKNLVNEIWTFTGLCRYNIFEKNSSSPNSVAKPNPNSNNNFNTNSNPSSNPNSNPKLNPNPNSIMSQEIYHKLNHFFIPFNNRLLNITSSIGTNVEINGRMNTSVTDTLNARDNGRGDAAQNNVNESITDENENLNVQSKVLVIDLQPIDTSLVSDNDLNFNLKTSSNTTLNTTINPNPNPNLTVRTTSNTTLSHILDSTQSNTIVNTLCDTSSTNLNTNLNTTLNTASFITLNATSIAILPLLPLFPLLPDFPFLPPPPPSLPPSLPSTTTSDPTPLSTSPMISTVLIRNNTHTNHPHQPLSNVATGHHLQININITAWNLRRPPTYLPLLTKDHNNSRPLLWFELEGRVVHSKRQGIIAHLFPERSVFSMMIRFRKLGRCLQSAD
jgi:hypothetical protein